jgi:hypothetical protein
MDKLEALIEWKRFYSLIETTDNYICSILYYQDKLKVTQQYLQYIIKENYSQSMIEYYQQKIINEINHIELLNSKKYIKEVLSKDISGIVFKYISCY